MEVKLCLFKKAEMLDKFDREIKILLVECHYGTNQSTSLMRFSLFWDDMQLRYMVSY